MGKYRKALPFAAYAPEKMPKEGKPTHSGQDRSLFSRRDRYS